MNSKALLSAFGDILGEKAAGLVSWGQKRNPWLCNPRNSCAMESWGRVIFCRDLRLCEPWEHSHVFVLESVLPSREESWLCASDPSPFPNLLIIFSRDLIFNRDQYCGALPLGKRENQPGLLLLVQQLPHHGTPCSRLNSSWECRGENAGNSVSHRILLERGTKEGQAGGAFPTLAVSDTLSECTE